MKKLLKFSTAFAIAIALVSCNKDEISTPDEMIDNQIDYTLDQIPIVENVQNTRELLTLTDDKDDEKIFGLCYEIGLATRELINNSKFVNTMIKLAKENPTPVVYLMDLKQDAPEYFQIINKNLAENNLSLEYIKENMTHRPILPNPEFPETSEIERYEPAIYIPNLKQVDGHKQALISPKVVTDGDKNPKLEDYIVTWYYTASGELKEILLSEETSIKTTNPLFIIDNAQRFEKNTVVLGGNAHTEPTRNDNSGDRSIIRFDSRELKIKNGYRYEAAAASEYAIVGYRIEGNPNGVGFDSWVYSGSGWKIITDISKNQIGQTVVSPSLHANVWTPYSNNRFFWNTFERDWYSSLKEIGQGTFDGKTVILGGNMQNGSEWYAYIPSTVQDHATPFEWFGWETSVNFYSWKADYVVHKIE